MLKGGTPAKERLTAPTCTVQSAVILVVAVTVNCSVIVTVAVVALGALVLSVLLGTAT